MNQAPFGIGAYTLTYIAALVLATLSYLLSLQDLGRFQLPIAMAIAALKAALIALIFIGLARSRASLVLTVLVALILNLMLLGFILLDVTMR